MLEATSHDAVPPVPLKANCSGVQHSRGLAERMFSGFGRAFESFDAAFKSPAGTQHVNRVISVEGLGRLRLGQVFAEGGFSFLHTGELLENPGRPVAVKRLSIAEPDALRRAQAEKFFLSSIPAHANIVAYHGCCFEHPDAFLVFELVDGGSLADFLDRRKGPMTPKLALAVLNDVMSAVVHLHSQSPPIAFRDLKLENILWDPSARHFKLCDFGSCTTVAKRYDDRSELRAAEEEIEENSSAMYRAPEMHDLLDRNSFLCEKVDVWAAGCVWFAILYNELPFDGQSAFPILQGRYIQPTSFQFPGTFTKLLTSMLAVDVAARADSFKILEAVCRLQGTAIDPELRLIGNRLRLRRGNEWMREIDDRAVDSGESSRLAARTSRKASGGDVDKGKPMLGSGRTVPTPTKPVLSSLSSKHLVALKDQQSHVISTGVDVCEDDDWADFKAAVAPGLSNTSSTPVQLSRDAGSGQSHLVDPSSSSSTIAYVEQAMQEATLGAATHSRPGESSSGKCPTGRHDSVPAVGHFSDATNPEAAVAASESSSNGPSATRRKVLTEDLFADLLPQDFK